MLGAIIGDIAGSPYEFENTAVKTTDFPLFSKQSRFTDDTVMSLAVAEGLMRGLNDIERSKQEVITSMQKYGRKYPHAGYGGSFYKWLSMKDPQPYGSYGNGSAMRVSSAAWLYDDISKVTEYAAAQAEVTHDHPEGIKGACAVAAAIFMTRKRESKNAVREYIEKTYGYDLSKTCDEIRPRYSFDSSCQGSVPQAITAFLDGGSFEEVIRLAISLGGDSDTLAAIAGSIAEAAYPIPEKLREEAMKRLDAELSDAYSAFRSFVKGV